VLVLFAKSRVKAHTRRLSSGKVVSVAEYTNRVQPSHPILFSRAKRDERTMNLFGELDQKAGESTATNYEWGSGNPPPWVSGDSEPETSVQARQRLGFLSANLAAELRVSNLETDADGNSVPDEVRRNAAKVAEMLKKEAKSVRDLMRRLEAQENGATPTMQRYAELKSSHPGSLVFMKMGDFFEAYNEDARIAAKVLEVALTRRGEAPMVGVPYHAIGKMEKDLQSAGHRAVFVER
jgi:hypothetical protein